MEAVPGRTDRSGRRFWLGEPPSLVEWSAEEIVTALERQEVALSTPLRVAPDAAPTPVSRYLRELVFMARQESGAAPGEVPLFQAAFHGAPFGLVIADIAGCILDCNAAFASLLGYRTQDLVGRSIGSLSVGVDRSEEIRLGMEMLSGLRVGFQVEKSFVSRTGATVHTLTAVALMQDGNGTPTGVVGHVLEIGTRKRLESLVLERDRARLEVEERFERLFRDAPQAMLMVDAESRILHANRAAGVLFGYPFGELEGHSIATLLPREFRADHERLVRDATANGTTARMAGGRDVFALRKDGRRLTVEVGLVPLRVDGVKLTLAGISDVTDVRRASEELTASLHEKETLLREVHHRVKNNLQIVSSLLAIQADSVASDPTRVALLDSVARVRSMALVHQLLYSLDSLARIDLRRYAEELAPSLARALRPEARLVVEGDSVEVSADVAVPVGLILNELVSNALKHAFPAQAGAAPTPGEPWDVRVTVRASALGLVLGVDDHGPGVGDALAERQGSLGVTLIKSLVRQLRGRLVVRGEMGARIEVHAPLR